MQTAYFVLPAEKLRAFSSVGETEAAAAFGPQTNTKLVSLCSHHTEQTHTSALLLCLLCCTALNMIFLFSIEEMLFLV